METTSGHFEVEILVADTEREYYGLLAILLERQTCKYNICRQIHLFTTQLCLEELKIQVYLVCKNATDVLLYFINIQDYICIHPNCPSFGRTAPLLE